MLSQVPVEERALPSWRRSETPSPDAESSAGQTEAAEKAVQDQPESIDEGSLESSSTAGEEWEEESDEEGVSSEGDDDTSEEGDEARPGEEELEEIERDGEMMTETEGERAGSESSEDESSEEECPLVRMGEGMVFDKKIGKPRRRTAMDDFIEEKFRRRREEKRKREKMREKRRERRRRDRRLRRWIATGGCLATGRTCTSLS